MDRKKFESKRKFIETPSGKVAYVEQGEGLVALFVHGVLVNGYLWRHQLEKLSPYRRCIAIDLMAHGSTQITSSQDVSFDAQAHMLVEFLNALNIDKVDIVGNDSGVGIAQIFAVNNPDRLRTLTLSNGDVHDNWPPEEFSGFLEMVSQGGLEETFTQMLTDKDNFRSQKAFGPAYERPYLITNESIEIFIKPLAATPEKTSDLARFILAFDNKQTVAIESRLKQLNAPTLIIWGTGDIFFDVKWSHWLAETIPGTKKRVEIANARLLFPEERVDEFNKELIEHWQLNA